MSVSTVDYDLEWSSLWDLYNINHREWILYLNLKHKTDQLFNNQLRHFREVHMHPKLNWKNTNPKKRMKNIYIQHIYVFLSCPKKSYEQCESESHFSMSQNTQYYDKLNKQSWKTTGVWAVSCFTIRNMIHMSFCSSSLASLKSIFSGNQKTTDNRRHGIIFKRKTYVCGMLSFSCLSNAIPCSLSHLNLCNGF